MAVRYILGTLFFALVLVIVSPLARAQIMTIPGYTVEVYSCCSSSPNSIEFIATDELFVLEKNNGHVDYFINGVFQRVVLDLEVANNSERGLLGIALDPDFATNQDLYLYYSPATFDGGTWTENRVQKFHMMPSRDLVPGPVLISFPVDPNQKNGPNHDGGYIRIGPDRKLYISTGDLNRGQTSNPRIEQNMSTTDVAGVGGIHRINLDGTIPADNPFASHSDPRIQSMWAYGVRNSYGMDWDPYSGRLWFTENGPNNYDELNMAPAGMNSGWVKIMGPDSRNFSFGENGNQNFDFGDLTALPGSKYHDPDMSWFKIIAPTGVIFPKTIKVNPSERDKMFMGDFSNGQIYMFSLNQNRDGLTYLPGTEDKVCDTNVERDLYLIGTGFGEVIDMRIGPDGYVYFSSQVGSVVYRIRPIVEECAPASLHITRGTVTSGGLASLTFSDDDRLSIRQGTVPNQNLPPVDIDTNLSSPTASPTQMSVRVEGQATSASIQQTLMLFDFSKGIYETIDVRNLGLNDSEVDLNLSGDLSRFVDSPTKTVRARLTYRANAPVFSIPWSIRLDQLIIRVKS